MTELTLLNQIITLLAIYKTLECCSKGLSFLYIYFYSQRFMAISGQLNYSPLLQRWRLPGTLAYKFYLRANELSLWGERQRLLVLLCALHEYICIYSSVCYSALYMLQTLHKACGPRPKLDYVTIYIYICIAACLLFYVQGPHSSSP